MSKQTNSDRRGSYELKLQVGAKVRTLRLSARDEQTARSSAISHIRLTQKGQCASVIDITRLS